MDTRFLSISNYTTDSNLSVAVTPSDILGDIINTKTNGRNIHKLYATSLGSNNRVYTYNFKTNKIELDEIVAIEHISGDFQCCEMSTYKTSPIIMPELDRIATVDRTAGYKLKFSTTRDLLNTAGLAVLQIEGYAGIKPEDDEDVDIMVASDESSELEVPITFGSGILIGCWLGSGKIQTYNDQDSVNFYPDTELDAEYIVNMLIESFPDNVDDIIKTTTKWNTPRVSFNNRALAVWLLETHGDGKNKTIPDLYYSQPMSFISGLIYGLMMTVGKHSINDHKKVMYYTFSSISETLISKIIEILNIYTSIHANLSSFIIEKSKKKLFLANIRVTSDVLETLPISNFVEDINQECIPKSNRHTLKNDDSVIVVTRMTVKQLNNCKDDYIIHLKNSSNIIGVTGLVHHAKHHY